ncbi:P-loop containing nucleoside triphosphate hydrolase protein [Multifurca ochricompacta]|uniref:P-loop containing nucleoside triphosphate hydrolase protein n=1 Tax=Multifurca ochricompacta TaxID=376703 RepID=A0AAD4MD57_9AGAM|nr:P-loop containing nucleoside triphosphate hydrolase protein [Multifurca ochricompacta]
MRAFGASPKKHLSSVHASRQGTRSGKHAKAKLPGENDPIHDAEYISKVYQKIPLKKVWEANPKSPLSNLLSQVGGNPPMYQHEEASIHGKRATIKVQLEGEATVLGVGDAVNKTDSEQLAALSALHQLNSLGKAGAEIQSTKLSDGAVVTYERSRQFMDYYCRRFGYGKPDIVYNELKAPRGQNPIWEAVMNVGGRRIGIGTGATKKAAQTSCFVDVTQYLESCDRALWETFLKEAAEGKDIGMAPKVLFQMSESLEDKVRDLCADIRKSKLYQNRPSASSHPLSSVALFSVPAVHCAPNRSLSPEFNEAKSQRLLERRKRYLKDPSLEHIRSTRSSLPVYTRSVEILSHIRDNEVTICMAATGSGKTTQIPQLVLDDYISRGEGAFCNIICTQPRRLAAISVAERVARERGESVGSGSVGYQVRFEAKLPEPNGSVTFCTTGIFLKRMQSALQDNDSQSHLGDMTHVIVDEVHERDVDTDLLLVVLKRLLADRKAKGKPLKVVLMSATIDPALFQRYFSDEHNRPAKVIEIPGRTFPVEQHFLDDFIVDLSLDPHAPPVFAEESVSKYIHRELGPNIPPALSDYLKPPIAKRSISEAEGAREDDLELPYPLIALTVCHVLQKSENGHVLPSPVRLWRYSIHLLHSSIPVAEQQMIFDPPPPGVRRIILSTNIAETSVTIPDVVHVVDTAKVKEQRYDPTRHMSSLVSAWVGSSNLKQRAGRAGRHRPGEYFGILGRRRVDGLHPYQIVEMKRVDLTNVVMHVKALDFPGMAVEEVLGAAIEPPAPDRIKAAMSDLQMVGAIDDSQNLTPLGRVLLQLPVDVQVGRLVLYGSFFRCLDQALTLAALMTNREPFVSPMHLKTEATAAKNSWPPTEFRSDALAALRAYNAWWGMQSRGEYVSANRFCSDNFLSKPTLLMVDRIKKQLLMSLQHAGVLDVSAGGRVESWGRGRAATVPPELNVNGDSQPLLAALIAIASQPKFAIRTSESAFRTMLDKTTLIHPSSVNYRKRDVSTDSQEGGIIGKKIIAYAEKRQNISTAGSSGKAPTFLVTTTRLDPMTYVLFGAYQIAVTARGLECDEWLPIVGNVYALDDIQNLKVMMEACMSRVFQGLALRRTGFFPRTASISPREEESGEEDDSREGNKDYSLSTTEVRELDHLTRGIVGILKGYAEERMEVQSGANSRPATPMDSPGFGNAKLASFSTRSGASTPYGVRSAYNSRPGTPSRLSSRPF